MSRNELNDFYNEGFGWICLHCERELSEPETSAGEHSRLMSEGEAESKQPRLSSPAIARWLDVAQTTLICPRCGITEPVDKF
jgi:hypothetical protein